MSVFMHLFKCIVCISILVLVGCNQGRETPTWDERKTCEGRKLLVLDHQNAKGEVWMFIAPDCPLSQQYVQSYNQLKDSFLKRGLLFLGVVPGKLYSCEEIQHFSDSFQFKPPIIYDADFHLAKYSEASVTPEFVLLDSAHQVLYHGAIDDWAIGLAQKKLEPKQFYLKDAIERYLDGRAIERAFVQPVGCFIEE
jgi:hypothetical protein